MFQFGCGRAMATLWRTTIMRPPRESTLLVKPSRTRCEAQSPAAPSCPMGTSTAATRILCVDDHELLADGLAGRMSLERDLEWAGRLPNADSLVEEARSRHADVVLLDLDMPGR